MKNPQARRATKEKKTRSHTDDSIFELAEYASVEAVRNPEWRKVSDELNQLAFSLESPGWKKRYPKGNKMSQTNKVLKMLKDGRTVTRVTAMHYGIMNLTARISELRQAGYDVKCRMKEDIDGNEYGDFYLADS